LPIDARLGCCNSDAGGIGLNWRQTPLAVSPGLCPLCFWVSMTKEAPSSGCHVRNEGKWRPTTSLLGRLAVFACSIFLFSILPVPKHARTVCMYLRRDGAWRTRFHSTMWSSNNKTHCIDGGIDGLKAHPCNPAAPVCTLCTPESWPSTIGSSFQSLFNHFSPFRTR
jgi:hypothetical protein